MTYLHIITLYLNLTLSCLLNFVKYRKFINLKHTNRTSKCSVQNVQFFPQISLIFSHLCPAYDRNVALLMLLLI